MKTTPIRRLIEIMARLRAPDGCPWDQQQTHRSLRFMAVEEAFELVDAIEADDDEELIEELGDLLLQVVFHAQLARERGAFDFDRVTARISEKLLRRHPHVFGTARIKTVAGVWSQWEQIKQAEKQGTHRERVSALDGIPKHLPALMQAEKLVKKARRAGLPIEAPPLHRPSSRRLPRQSVGRELFRLAQYAQQKGWSAEELLRQEVAKQKKRLQRAERSARRDS